MYVKWGCPLAGLTRDLRQEAGALESEATRIYEVQFQWLSIQFQLAGFPLEKAQAHCRYLMASYHGAILLSFAQNDESLIDHVAASLKGWLRNLQQAPLVQKA